MNGIVNDPYEESLAIPDLPEWMEDHREFQGAVLTPKAVSPEYRDETRRELRELCEQVFQDIGQRMGEGGHVDPQDAANWCRFYYLQKISEVLDAVEELVQKGLVSKEVVDGEVVYRTTDYGKGVLDGWE